MAFLVPTLYPAVALILFSFKTPLQWDNSRWTLTLPLRWQNYQVAWDIIHHYLFNTILVASVSTIGATLLCSITAFAFARLRFPGREFFYWAIIFMLTVPTLLNLIPQFVLYHNLGLINTRWALIIQYIVQSGPFGVFLFRAFFRSIPEELFEVGAYRWLYGPGPVLAHHRTAVTADPGHVHDHVGTVHLERLYLAHGRDHRR